MSVMFHDGGGGGAGVSSDGLICPEAFWGRARDLDTEAIRASAAGLRALGVEVFVRTGDIQSVWNELAGVYVSPEAWRVYSLLGPAVAKADGIEDRFDRGAKYLETLAYELDAIRPALADLEERATVFRARALAGVEVKVDPTAYLGDGSGRGGGYAAVATDVVHWKQDTGTVDENAALVREYLMVVEQITMSVDSCARGIRRVIDPFSSPTGRGGGVGVLEAGQLEAAGVLPFGGAVSEDRNCGESIGDGMVDFGRGIGEGAGMLLLGYNPQSGAWFDGGACGQAWGGLGNLAGSIVVVGLGAGLVSQVAPGSRASQWAGERHDVVASAVGSLVGYDHGVAQEGGDGWHQWREDGVRVGAASVLNIGTFFVPGAGALGSGAKGGSIAVKVGAAASTVAEVVVPGGSWLLKGGVSAARYGEAAVTVARGGTAAVLDTHRLTQAGILAALDDVASGTGHSPVRPQLSDSFAHRGPAAPHGLGATSSGPSITRAGSPPVRLDPRADNAVNADLARVLGENPYTLPDYAPSRAGTRLETGGRGGPESSPLVGDGGGRPGGPGSGRPGGDSSGFDGSPGSGRAPDAINVSDPNSPPGGGKGWPDPARDYPRPHVAQVVEVTGRDLPGSRTPFWKSKLAHDGLEPNTLYHVEGRGDFYTNTEGRIDYVEATYGRRGPNMDLHDPKPNTTYVVHPEVTYPRSGASYSHVFVTDVEGRTVLAHTDRIARGDGIRSESIQSRIGNLADGPDVYNGGHDFGTGFGGGPESLNVSTQLERINQNHPNSFYRIEAEWRKLIPDGEGPLPDIEVDIQKTFQPGDPLPLEYLVDYRVNGGDLIRRRFRNV